MDRLALRCVLSLLAVLGASQGIASCRAHQAPSRVRALATPAERTQFIPPGPLPSVRSTTLTDNPIEVATVGPSHRDRCEPLSPSPCPSRDYACPDMPDGTPRTCRHPYRQPAAPLACLPGYSPADVRAWRVARLAAIVDAVQWEKERAEDLAAYLQVMAGRETSLRPWKRHRLPDDIEAATRSWERRAEAFDNSPAASEPLRWATGVGYYGQNPALWLQWWDSSAEPEVLCGEVESTLVHLRAARKRWLRLEAGITCNGETFHGSSPEGRPSWYDISLVNSGSKACPAQPDEGERYKKRQDFARRCERVGLDPYEAIELETLGAPVDSEDQDAFAAELYKELDRVSP